MTLKRKTAPSSAPVSLSEAKAYMREDGTDQDTIISLLIASVTGWLDGTEGIMGRCLMEQTWEFYPDVFPSGDLQIPLGNLIAVDGVEYIDPTTGLYVTWPSSNYTVDTVPVEGCVSPVTAWPVPKARVRNPIRITFRAGFGAQSAAVPAAIREAILMLVVDRFDNRAAVSFDSAPTSLPFGVDDRLAPFRRKLLARS